MTGREIILKRTCSIGHLSNPVAVRVWVEAEIYKKGEDDSRPVLSITGVIGPKASGDAYGSCGQILDDLDGLKADSRIDVSRLLDIWRKWHLNDMHPDCEHMIGPEWDPKREIHFIGFKRTARGYELKKSVEEGKLSGQAYMRQKHILAELERWHGECINQDRIPRGIQILVNHGYMERWHWDYIEKTQIAGWTEEKLGGILGKACPICGVRYGDDWQYRALPQDVIEFIASLPNDRGYPWNR